MGTTLLLVIGLVATVPQEGIDDLIRRWRSDDPAVREGATKALVTRWKTWAAKDLAKLRRAGTDPDAEVAARARRALSRITFCRTLGEPMLKRLEGIETALHNHNEEVVIRLMGRARSQWKRNKITESEMQGLFGALGETRGVLAAAALLEATLGIDRFAPRIVPLLRHENEAVRANAAYALARMNAVEQTGRIAPMLNHESAGVRASAALALAWIGAQDRAHRISPLLRDEDARVRQFAAYALDRWGAGADLHRQLRKLRRKRHRDRWILVDQLARTGVVGYVNRVLARLSHKDAHVRLTAAQKVVAMGVKEHAARVIPLLTDDDPSVQASAAYALGEMGAREFADRLLPLLESEDAAVRALGLFALGRMGAKEQAERIVQHLEDESGTVRGIAAEALVDAGASEHAGRILPLLGDADAAVRARAALALARSGLNDQSRRILPLLRDEEAMVREYAAHALRVMRAREHSGDLLPLLADGRTAVKAAATEALIRLLGLGLSAREMNQWARKLQALESNSDERVRICASIVLLSLGRKEGAASMDLVTEIWFERRWLGFLRPALSVALSKLHEPEGYETLTRVRELKNPIETTQDLKRILADAGLQLDWTYAERMTGRLSGGSRTDLLNVLDAMVPELLFVLEGDTLQLMTPEAAIQSWRGRFKLR